MVFTMVWPLFARGVFSRRRLSGPFLAGLWLLPQATTWIRILGTSLAGLDWRFVLRAAILLVLLVSIVAVPLVSFGPVRIPRAHALLSMPNPEYTFFANFQGWNFSQSSGTNPTIASIYIFPGQTLTANSHSVDSVSHTLSYYAPGTTAAQVHTTDVCGAGNSCLASVSIGPSTPATLQFAFSSADTFEIYCQVHPFAMHAQVFVDRSPDINGDHTVNVLDLVRVALAFGTSSGQPGFNPNADLNRDNTVNILDLVDVAANFGRTV